METQSPAQWIFIAIAVALVIFRNMRPQKLRLGRIWVVPVLLLLVTMLSIWGSQQIAPAPIWMTVLALVAGTALGALLGLARGQHSRLRLSEKPGTVIIDPSMTVLLIWLAAFAVKFGMRALMPHADALSSAGSDAFIALAVASVIASRWVIYKKARALEATAGPVVA